MSDMKVKNNLKDSNFSNNSLTIVKYFSHCLNLEIKLDSLQKEQISDSFKFRKHGNNLHSSSTSLLIYVKSDKNFRYKNHNKIDLFNPNIKNHKRRLSHEIIVPKMLVDNYLTQGEFRYVDNDLMNSDLKMMK